ncbi:hypothetical protein [Streptomyces celluloflavus]|uniref:hypothetical protein n=1 Tax=Streptomyces celluloflavus TaxID=58344 RepID=UPI003677CAC4
MTETPTRRILTHDEYDAAYARLKAQARLHGTQLSSNTAHAALTAALAMIDVYGPAPEPEPDTCTALYLPTNTEEDGPDILGVWQQCFFEPGHDDADGHESDCGWSDDMPGAIPARTTDQETA